MKNIFISGSNGFIGKNLVVALKRRADVDIIEYDLDSPLVLLEKGLATADIIYHLAGVNRPERLEEYAEGNYELTRKICDVLLRLKRSPLFVMSSSSQAALDNPYGLSKRRAEEVVFEYSRETGARVSVFRLPGVFGKWCRPNYNSVVATFCHNVARDLPIVISDPEKEIEIVHVDDVVGAFLRLLEAETVASRASFLTVQPVFRIALGKLAGKIRKYRTSRETLSQPGLSGPLDRRLFGTYISYLPEDEFDYDLTPKVDERGLLAEIMKLEGHGQIFVSRTNPGITRGNHYHDLKVEKFIVLEGEAIIRFRHMVTNENIEYPVEGREMRVIDIPPGWTHSIQNTGASEMIVLFWASEVFDRARPDTFFAKVRNDEA